MCFLKLKKKGHNFSRYLNKQLIMNPSKQRNIILRDKEMNDAKKLFYTVH